VFGAYPTAAVRQLHRPEKGFYVEGFAPTVEGAMAGARVLLAPLRFGAGIKGKIVDAWANGLPAGTYTRSMSPLSHHLSPLSSLRSLFSSFLFPLSSLLSPHSSLPLSSLLSPFSGAVLSLTPFV
jgi:hypothetical protein